MENFPTKEAFNIFCSFGRIFRARRVARNLQWGGCLGGLGAEPPAAGGQWESGGLGAKLPAAGGTGVWGRSPQRLKILNFFAKLT